METLDKIILLLDSMIEECREQIKILPPSLQKAVREDLKEKMRQKLNVLESKERYRKGYLFEARGVQFEIIDQTFKDCLIISYRVLNKDNGKAKDLEYNKIKEYL